MRALSCQRRIHRARLPIRPTPNDREIFFRDPLFLHEQPKTASGGCVFRDKHQSARFAVEAVHDGNLASVRDLEGEQLFQLAPERQGVVRFARMNEKERRLFHHDAIGCLGHYGEIGAVCASRFAGG